MERTDVIVDYLGEQFIIEMKIWRGNAYHERGEQQLLDFLILDVLLFKSVLGNLISYVA